MSQCIQDTKNYKGAILEQRSLLADQIKLAEDYIKLSERYVSTSKEYRACMQDLSDYRGAFTHLAKSELNGCSREGNTINCPTGEVFVKSNSVNQVEGIVKDNLNNQESKKEKSAGTSQQ